MRKDARTVREVFDELCGQKNFFEFFKWPPNSFAFTSVLLGDSGAYRCVVDPTPGNTWPPRAAKSWTSFIAKEGELWRDWFEGGKPSIELSKLILKIKSNLKRAVIELNNAQQRELREAVLELHAIADSASAGLGVGVYDGKQNFYLEGFQNLFTKNSLSTIDTSRIRVLPKMRTPQVGISLRSLSHHLAVSRSEVNVNWVSQIAPKLPTKQSLNLLLLPWPLNTDPSSFKEVDWPLKNMDRTAFGFFEYAPQTPFDIKYVLDSIKSARTKVGQIHGVVLPESALTEHEREHLEVVLKQNGVAFFIAGIRAPQKNYAHLGLLYGEEYLGHIQHKHHRWQLERRQIEAYHLGSALHPSKKYWEAISVPERSVSFVCFSDWLTMCHLICEDLARHDPVSNLIRAVGPNLVVALLLDGPQLGARWPGRYASVLADDPGSSVLTVTSLGMALRSRPDGKSPSRVIALWKDPTGAREISLEEGCKAAVLSLCASFHTEITGDGRTDNQAASELVLAGVEYIQTI